MLEQDRIIKINIEEEMKSSYIDLCRSLFHVPFRMLEMVLNPFTEEFFSEMGNLIISASNQRLSVLLKPRMMLYQVFDGRFNSVKFSHMPIGYLRQLTGLMQDNRYCITPNSILCKFSSC